jgi:hypothetical protein
MVVAAARAMAIPITAMAGAIPAGMAGTVPAGAIPVGVAYGMPAYSVPVVPQTYTEQ